MTGKTDGQAPASPARKRAFVALVGAACAALCVPLVSAWEGKRNVAYRDIVDVWTICYGDTSNVRPGQRASDAECLDRLDDQLARHAAPVLACTPALRGRPPQLAAAISLAYNIGTWAYCRSTVDRRFDRGQWRDACDGFLAWRYAGGREVRGLLNRRRAERTLCLKDLPA